MSRRDTYYAYNSLHIHVSLPAGELLYLPSRKTDYLFPGSAGGIGSSISFFFSSYWVAEFGKHILSPGLTPVLRWIGSWWIGFSFYAVIILLLIDLVRLAGHVFHLLPAVLPETFPGCPAVLSNRYRRGSSYPSPGRLF